MLALLVETLLWLLVALLVIPLAVLLVESLAALLPHWPAAPTAAARPRWAALVPAHNEETGIHQTLADLVPQAAAGDRVLVVADNCCDRTAELARAAGAVVVERTSDRTQRGKGYALDFGVRHLQQDPPDVVVIVDADCRVPAGGLERLAREAHATGRPVQAVYLMDVPPGGGPTKQLSAFAFLFKNLVRPLGLDRLGLPCLLTGSGMAFPWAVLRDAHLATGNIVEDMKLGLDLAIAGRPPRLCPEVTVGSVLPSGDQAVLQQRERWEQGHVITLFTQAPRLLWAGLRQARPSLLGLALELSVPPLALLLLLWAAVTVGLAGWWAWTGNAGPALVLGGAGLAVLLGIFLAWVRFGRRLLPGTSLLRAPLYILIKVPIYVALLFGKVTGWHRTARDAAPPAGKPPVPGDEGVPAAPDGRR